MDGDRAIVVVAHLTEELLFKLQGPALVGLQAGCQVSDVCTLQHHLHNTSTNYYAATITNMCSAESVLPNAMIVSMPMVLLCYALGCFGLDVSAGCMWFSNTRHCFSQCRHDHTKNDPQGHTKVTQVQATDLMHKCLVLSLYPIPVLYLT